jgi:hypothetical protein
VGFVDVSAACFAIVEALISFSGVGDSSISPK